VLITTIIKKANIQFWYITMKVKQAVSIWPWVVMLFQTSRITAWKSSGSFVEPGGSLMQVWGDTGTGGSKILDFQIQETGGYVFCSLLLLLGNETSRCRSRCGGRSRLRSFPMVSCMLLSHHGSQTVQTSRFSAARIPMDTCEMCYIERFWKCSL
jgi:hypothetical protein